MGIKKAKLGHCIRILNICYTTNLKGGGKGRMVYTGIQETKGKSIFPWQEDEP